MIPRTHPRLRSCKVSQIQPRSAPWIGQARVLWLLIKFGHLLHMKKALSITDVPFHWRVFGLEA